MTNQPEAITRVIEAVKAAIPDAAVIDLEVVDWEEWDRGDIDAGLFLTSVERDGHRSAWASFPDRMLDLRAVVADDLRAVPVEWWASNVSEHGYASIVLDQS